MAITLDEARAGIGLKVIYRAGHEGAKPEEGVVTEVRDLYVFVRYGSQVGAQATPPERLEWLAPEPRSGTRDWTLDEFDYVDGKRVQARCPAKDEGKRQWTWYCTRAEGHDGQHAAGDGDSVLAVW